VTDASAVLPVVQSVADGAMPGVVAIEASPFPDWITVAGSAWVANVGDGVARYDRTTGQLIGMVPTGTNICLAMDTALGSLWVGDCTTTTLIRVNLESGAVEATIALPFTSITEESSVAASEDGVFVLGDRKKTIARIDPTNNTVTGTFAAPKLASALRAGEGSLWVTSNPTKTLSRLDPSSGDVVATVGVGGGAGFLAIGDGCVWVLNANEGTVSRVDPASNSVVASIVVSDGKINGGDMAFGGGYAWARVSDALVAQIDPATNTVVARYGPLAGSGSVAADDSAVWISAHDITTVWRVPIN
jgi:virginiamycin B lyase